MIGNRQRIGADDTPMSFRPESSGIFIRMSSALNFRQMFAVRTNGGLNGSVSLLLFVFPGSLSVRHQIRIGQNDLHLTACLTEGIGDSIFQILFQFRIL